MHIWKRAYKFDYEQIADRVKDVDGLYNELIEIVGKVDSPTKKTY